MYKNLLPNNNQRNVIDVLKESTSIETVAQKLNMQLSRVGSELRGDCPTGHSSHSHYSFCIIPDKNFFYCFNCTESGDVISLVMLVRGYDFKNAILWLASEYRPDLKSSIEAQSFTVDPMIAAFYSKAMLFEEVFKLGRPILYGKAGQIALASLRARGYTQDNLEKTEWIYWPHEAAIKSHLKNTLPQLSSQIDELPLTGHYGDNFRLAFPYRNREGQITGFMKRADLRAGITVHGQQNVRWDSTPGLKKTDLFGMNRIKKNTERLVIVEGYPDALYLPSLGLEHIAAVGQGKLSRSHIDGLLARSVQKVIISFDNDGVGPDNTEAAVDLLNEAGIRSFVIEPSLLGVKDPDELVIAKGVDAFLELVENAESGATWKAKRILKKHNIGTDIGKSEALDEVMAFEESTNDPLATKAIIDVVCSGLNITVEMLEPHFKSYRDKVSNERLSEGVQKLLKDAHQHVEDRDPLSALDLLAEGKSNLLLDYERNRAAEIIPLETHLRQKQTRDGMREPGELLGYGIQRFPTIERHLQGLQAGLYILGAYPNVGKTSFLVNLGLSILESNKEASVAIFSMDDNTETIINRILARMTDMSINEVQYKQSDIAKRQQLANVYEYLIAAAEAQRLVIKDVNEIHTMDDVELLVRQHPNQKHLTVLIDGLYNVGVEGDHEGIRQENIQRANKAKAISKQFLIPVITTAELRKKISNQSKATKPSMHDIMESGKYGYNADVIWLLYPKDEEAARTESEPEMVFKFEKNKLSEFKDSVPLQFFKAKSIYREMPTLNTFGKALVRQAA